MNKFNFLKEDETEATLPNIAEEVLKCFNHSIKRETFCDFTVVVDGFEFPCHRFVLNACSGFFEALFRTDMKETREMKATVKGMSPETFKLILDIIYSGFNVLTPENMLDLWEAAHQLNIEFLVSICEGFVVKNINPNNCYKIYKQAQIFQSLKVIDFLFSYLTKQFFHIVNSDAFSQLEFDDFVQILKVPEPSVCTDFQINAILKWCGLMDDTEPSTMEIERQLFLGNLMQVVNLSLASTECLASLMTNDCVLANKAAITAVCKQATQNLLTAPSIPVLNTKLRRGVHKRFISHFTNEECPHCN